MDPWERYTSDVFLSSPIFCVRSFFKVFSIYFYITVCSSRPIHFFSAENFLQWYKCLSGLQATIGGGSGGD